MESLPAERVVTFYGNIAEAALKARFDAEYCVYGVGKTMQKSSGANGILKAELIAEVQRLGMFTSAAHVRKLLRSGAGLFWTLKADRVWLESTGDVARLLGIRKPNGHRHQVSTRCLQTREARRATLMTVTMPIGKPIRQQTIRQHTGVSETTQRRYRRKGYLTARRQDANVTSVFDAPTPQERRIAAQHERHHGVYAVGPDAVLHKRLPNVYSFAGTRIPRGRRSKEIFSAQPLYAVAEGALTVPRVFFESVDQWVRCRCPRLGRPENAHFAYPYNASYTRSGVNRWEAVAC